MHKHLLTIITALASLTLVQAQAPVNVQAVDLGLSVKWASCNVGADTVEGRGNFYAWGETELKTDYSWETYKHANGANNKLTKYCDDGNWGNDGFADGKTSLEPDDDVAYQKWGRDWRIPSYEEWKELYANCTVVSTTQNGVDGHKVTSNINGNSIFLPTAGVFNVTTVDMKSGGFYWSSSLVHRLSDTAWSVRNYYHIVGTNTGDRQRGMLVRPVQGDYDSITDTPDIRTATPAAARKVLRNGQVLILRNGVYYDVHGRVQNP